MDLLYDKSNYLKNYIDKFYSEININKNIELFVKMLNDKISNIKVLVDNLSYQVDSDYISKIYECLYGILNANSYEEIKNNLEIKLPILPKNSSEESKKIKEQISSIIKELKSIAIYEDINGFYGYNSQTGDRTYSCKDIKDILFETIIREE